MKNVVLDNAPLIVTRIDWNDPTLVFGGDNWHFCTTSTWRLVSVDGYLCGSEDDGASESLALLKGRGVIDLLPQENRIKVDPVLCFSGDYYLEVFSAWIVEPWDFEIKGGGIFVASPSDP